MRTRVSLSVVCILLITTSASAQKVRYMDDDGDEGWRTAMVTPTKCGDPLSVNCFGPIGSFDPYCDDFCDADSCKGCCDTVCGNDPGCCDVAIGFDAFCVNHAQQVCPCVPGQDEPPNDECAGAIDLLGLGDFPVSNQCATVGGPEHSNSACHDGDGFGINAHGLDVWYTHVATFTGELNVSTCGLIENTWDSIILFYEGCDCGTLGEPIGCNNDGLDDDLKECPNGSSLLRVDVSEGTCYTIRLGSSFNDVSGSGTLELVSPGSSCPADLDGDGTVGASDLAQLLGNWGPCEGCPADFNGDGVVDAADLAQLLGAWGLCP